MAEYPQVADLVPHSGSIVLLDSISSVTEAALQASTQVRADDLFNNNPTQVASFIALEYMAQAIAAWAGYHGRQDNLPIQPGLLLGAREFSASSAFLKVGEVVDISVQRVMETPAGLAVFDGSVSRDSLIIKARLSVLTVKSWDDIKRHTPVNSRASS